ncbi:hypothetical protein [Sphingosinicella sp.]|uniref:hypothetical protein n=1 Tax=Sphingosinicella sp. TaxID=1917971 RepID=UPI00260360AE|nr:hypothetical protein [Sphingosinicella sp.]
MHRHVLPIVFAILLGSLLQTYFAFALQFAAVAIANGHWLGSIGAVFYALSLLPVALLTVPIKFFGGLLLLTVAMLLEAATARRSALFWIFPSIAPAAFELAFFSNANAEAATVFATVGGWMIAAMCMCFIVHRTTGTPVVTGP